MMRVYSDEQLIDFPVSEPIMYDAINYQAQFLCVSVFEAGTEAV